MESREEIEEAAAAWICKHTGGEWSSSDEAGLAAWLEASTAHRVAFLRLDSAWQEAGRLKAVGAGVPAGRVPTPEELNRSPFAELKAQTPLSWASQSLSPARVPSPLSARRPRRAYWAMAAALLCGILVMASEYFLSRGPDYQTETGSVAAVPMPDGSKVTLNTDTRIRVAVTDSERQVNLIRGEAFFEVAKDSRRPFVVNAGNERVIAVGTKFSVRRGEGSVRVVVLDGRVRVDPGMGAGSAAAPTEVGAGSVARTRAGVGILVEKKSSPDLEPYLSWRNGYLIFRNTPLADAVAEFNRYNKQKVVLKDRQLAQMHIDGNFRATNVGAFLRLLEDGFEVTTEYQDDQILVRAK